MKYVYLLWYHTEDGPDNVKASLSRDVIQAMVTSIDDDSEADKYLETFLPLMKKADSDLYVDDVDGGIYKLGKGWGGLHFQIVELS